MAKIKVVNADQLDADLQRIANAIKARLGYSSSTKLSFPEEFISGINLIGDMVEFTIYDYSVEDDAYIGKTVAGTTWGDYADEHIGDGFLYESSVSFQGSEIRNLQGEVVQPDWEIKAGSYFIN